MRQAKRDRGESKRERERLTEARRDGWRERQTWREEHTHARMHPCTHSRDRYARTHLPTIPSIAFCRLKRNPCGRR